MSVLANIENGIKTLLDSTGISVISGIVANSKVIAEIPSDIRYPAICWAINKGDIRGTLAQKLVCEINIQFVVIFQNHKNEKEARHNLYPCLEALIGLLNGQTFTLNCSGLVPIAFTQVQVEGSPSLGTMAFKIDFKTICDIEIIDEDTSSNLIEILNKYYDEDDNKYIEDLIDLT